MLLVKRMRSVVHQVILFSVWLLVRRLVRAGDNAIPSALILPCDPRLVTGSRGDQAMLEVAVAWAGTVSSSVSLGISGRPGAEVARQYGANPVEVNQSVLMPLYFLRVAIRSGFQHALVMGADMMDGYYSPVVSLRLIIAADLLSRAGCNVRFLGFSFNRQPSRLVVSALKRLDRGVVVNLRDSGSYSRYTTWVNPRGRLVADCAFLLKPQLGDSVKSALEWIEQERSLGQKVVGLNLHQLLFPVDQRPVLLARLIRVVTETIRLDAFRNVSWLLIPHDDRAVGGDVAALRDLYASLSTEGSSVSRAFLVKTVPQAKEIKALVSHVDGIVAARMHLAIAALGVGVPVLVLKYQDKFDGLLLDFDLPSGLLVDPRDMLEGGVNFADVMGAFIQDLDGLRRVIIKNLPSVSMKSKSTFS